MQVDQAFGIWPKPTEPIPSIHYIHFDGSWRFSWENGMRCITYIASATLWISIEWETTFDRQQAFHFPDYRCGMPAINWIGDSNSFINNSRKIPSGLRTVALAMDVAFKQMSELWLHRRIEAHMHRGLRLIRQTTIAISIALAPTTYSKSRPQTRLLRSRIYVGFATNSLTHTNTHAEIAAEWVTKAVQLIAHIWALNDKTTCYIEQVKWPLEKCKEFQLLCLSFGCAFRCRFTSVSICLFNIHYVLLAHTIHRRCLFASNADSNRSNFMDLSTQTHSHIVDCIEECKAATTALVQHLIAR